MQAIRQSPWVCRAHGTEVRPACRPAVAPAEVSRVSTTPMHYPRKTTTPMSTTLGRSPAVLRRTHDVRPHVRAAARPSGRGTLAHLGDLRVQLRRLGLEAAQDIARSLLDGPHLLIEVFALRMPKKGAGR
eukprot:scaffold6781_cov107-Isochrysis_galbana.AAC.9